MKKGQATGVVGVVMREPRIVGAVEVGNNVGEGGEGDVGWKDEFGFG